MAQIALYIPFSDINGGVPSTMEQFHKQLSVFPRRRVLHVCSIINAMLRHQTEPLDRDAHDGLVRAFFRKELADRFLKREGYVRFVFHRQQVLYVAKEAMLHCRDDSRIPLPEDSIGEVFLMAGDHLPARFSLSDFSDLAEKFAATATHLLPVQEASGFDYVHKMCRAYLMLTDSLEKLRHSATFVDIPAQFERAVGFDLRTFYALMFGAITRFVNFDPAQYIQNPESYSLQEGWFKSTKIAPELLIRFLDYVSAMPESFAEEIRSRDLGASDFTSFRKRPLFRDELKLFLLDFPFLAEKVETGPFWTVHEALPNGAERDLLHSFWGSVFEQYTNDLLLQAGDPKINAVYPSPVYADRNEQVCDAIVVCGDAAAFVEIKGATFSAGAKYGGNPDDLRAELERKLVQSDGAPKAVQQLAAAIEQTCRYSHPNSIRGIDLGKVATVFPVIVTRDDIGAIIGVNSFLDYRFNALLKRKELVKSIAPIVCLSAENLERLTPYFSDSRFTAILAAHLAANRARGKHVKNPMFTMPNEVLEAKGERKPPILHAAFHELTECAIERLGLSP